MWTNGNDSNNDALLLELGKYGIGTQGSEKSSTNSMHVGFLSRELSSNEKAAEGTSELLCKDGIVVVVNAKNTCIDNLTAKQLVTIYSKENTKWSDLLK